MIDVTVKTLDSQNKSFSVEEEMTVRQFKEKIADSINISADTQRLIFQGRVMQDEKLLKDYNVHGKVIHVVHRLPPTARPPSSTPGGATPSTRPTAPRDVNSFVIGSVSVPSDSVDADEIQNIVQDAISGMGEMGRNARVSTRTSNDGSSVDVHIHLGQGQVESESQQRINQARQMLRVARDNLQILENRQRGSEGSSSPMDSSSVSPPQSNTSQQTREESNDVVMESDESQTPGQSQAGQTPSQSQPQAGETSSQSPPQTGQNNSQSQQPSQNNGQSQQPGQGAAGTTPNGTSQEQPRMVRPRISALGEVLNEVHEINRRFQPFLERYQQLLLDDPELSEQELQENTQLCNLVGEISHAIGHCYHNLSDLMIDLNQPRPRHLYAAFVSPPVQTTLIHQQTIPVHINANLQSPRQRRPNQSMATTTSASTSTPTPPTNTAGSQTERTSTQSAGTSTGPTFSSGATGIPPEGSEQLFQMFDMGPDSVTEISAHVIPTERDMPPGSVHVSTAPSNNGNIPGIPPDLIQNIVSSVVMGHIDPSGRIQANVPGGSRSFAEATMTTLSSTTPSSTTPTNSSSTQTGTGPTNSSETQTSATVTNTSGTQTRPRAAAFMMPGLPGGIPPGIPGMSGMSGMSGMPGMPGMPGMGGMGGMRGVDPYLPCSSRHFLRQQVRNATSQGAQVEISMPNMPNLMANVMGQLHTQQSGPRATGPAVASRTTNTASAMGSTPTVRPTASTTANPTSTASSTTGPRPNFQFASFPGGPGIPAGVSIQMGSIPPGMPVPPGMFGPGQIGNFIGNLIGGAQGRFRPGGPFNPPTAGTTPPQGNRPRPTSQPQGNTGTPAGGQPTDGQQGEPMFVQMLRTMLSGAQQQSGSTTTPNTTASTPAGSSTTTTTTSSGTSSSSSSSTEPVMTDDVFASLVQGISGIVTRTALGQGPPETIANFLSGLGESHQIVPGEGFIHDVFNVAANHLTFPNLIQVFYGSGQPLDQLRRPLQQFFKDGILNGRDATAENIVQAVDTLVNDMQEELRETASVSEVKPHIDLVESWNNFFRAQLISITTFIMRAESDGGFGQELYNRIRVALSLLIVLTRHCLVGGMSGLQSLIHNRLQYITRGVNPMIQQWMISVTTQQLDQFLPTITVTEAEMTTYLVLKKDKKKPEVAPKPSPMDTTSPGASQPEEREMKQMEVESSKAAEAAAQPSTSRMVNGNNSSGPKRDTAPKPEPAEAAVGAEGWEKEIPEEWVPVINGDVQKQKQQRHQPPFSDAYLDGMPPKRRRLMTQDRPGDLANIPQSLTDQLSRAARAAGVEPISSMENLRAEVSTNTELQSVYEQQVHNTIAHRVSHDKDYKKDRFPNTQAFVDNDKNQ